MAWHKHGVKAKRGEKRKPGRRAKRRLGGRRAGKINAAIDISASHRTPRIRWQASGINGESDAIAAIIKGKKGENAKERKSCNVAYASEQ